MARSRRQTVRHAPRSLALPAGAEYFVAKGATDLLARRPAPAYAAYTEALKFNKDCIDALRGRALALHELGRDQEALFDYDAALALAPRDEDLWHNFGVSLLGLDAVDDALLAFARALDINPSYAAAAESAAFAESKRGRFFEAVTYCDRLLEKDPRNQRVLRLKADALLAGKNFGEALKVYDIALRHASRNVELLINRTTALLSLNRRDEAFESAKQALACDNKEPLAWRAYGNVALKLGLYETALDAFVHALGPSPHDAEALCGQAITQKELGDFDAAMRNFDAALALDSEHDDAKSNKGALLLLLGRYPEGLPFFEYRRAHNENLRLDAKWPWPEWRGEDLTGKRLLVLDEAGLGDVIQYCRYFPLLTREPFAGRGKPSRVAFGCRASMRALIETLDPPIELVTDVRPDAFDLFTPLCSLPLVLGTSVGAIPAPGHYLAADSGRRDFWRERIGTQGFKIGVSWRGSSTAHSDDTRSAPLGAFAPLAELPGVRLISLQKNEGVQEIAGAKALFRVEELGPDFDAGPDAFLDTAAAMEAMDLVVTIDTSLAHLAGALGRPTWIALKYVPEWRWLLQRDDSPWYPTARLFRQRAPSDWDSVFADMTEALRAKL
ncbi:tetratricopeptide repeat protein [Methylocystis sp. MJC1]|jgi:tetratricopeptide (TPR) repeat protein|uniref:tetratricopeptide repeat-containing glycosyltransferase family protein n=1 Tax=Methylocystis sp. MJC1 TaxID=2654282 RepID=UPI0013EB5735|nr:tetratricopeptide repeat protein [Methylocystis sp. MJC1]KAF2989118.1 Beta-barrel assembly-enhancing protease [Methylocystis sp. MJC1]MBU6528432.1 tetratricopeptide repeat protein [Methylocystis sp. MJC1]UZX11332.1 tetratricopeptide repeat protein [Methylocystis sp. MJC1]